VRQAVGKPAAGDDHARQESSRSKRRLVRVLSGGPNWFSFKPRGWGPSFSVSQVTSGIKSGVGPLHAADGRTAGESSAQSALPWCTCFRRQTLNSASGRFMRASNSRSVGPSPGAPLRATWIIGAAVRPRSSNACLEVGTGSETRSTNCPVQAATVRAVRWPLPNDLPPLSIFAT
jgi:hypothetical protein